MNRNEKQDEINNLKQNFSKSQLAILADYKGLSSNDFNVFRRKLREKGSTVKVIKNRLAKIAAKETAFDVLISHLSGTIVMATTDADPTGPAKALSDFAKSNEKIKIKVAAMQGKLITAKEVEALASLPSKEELIAKLLGSMQAPARNLVCVMAQIPRQVVNVLAAIRDQKEKGAPKN